jgi:myo-inositol catabolism protein IolC
MYLLAMDHRSSLARDVYGIDGPVDAYAARLIADGKRLVFNGLVTALEHGADRELAGVLVDERYGPAVARSAREVGVTLAIPIERSGEQFFTPEYAGDWLPQVETLDPDYVKVLVRDNPEFDRASRERQWRDLAAVSAKLHDADLAFLFELVVPPTQAQRSKRYDTDVRPDLTVQVITELQDAGVEPDIWKIEGLEAAGTAAAMVTAAQRGGRDNVRCIVLGRDAPTDRLDHWLRVAAATDGFIGFAIGRSIWEKPLTGHVAGKLEEDAAVDQIAENYLHFCATYRSAEDRAK